MILSGGAHRRRPAAALLAAGHRRAHRGRAAAAHPRPAPTRLRHRGGTVRRRPARRPELPSVACRSDERYDQAGMLLDRLAGDGRAARGRGRRPQRAPRRAHLPPPRRPSSRTAGPSAPGAASTPPRRPTRTSASTRSSRRAAWRCWAAACRRGLPGVTETDLRAATDHLPVLAALQSPRAAGADRCGRYRPRDRDGSGGARSATAARVAQTTAPRPGSSSSSSSPCASASPAWRNRRGSRRCRASSATRSCPSRAAPRAAAAPGRRPPRARRTWRSTSASGSGGGSGGTKWPSSSVVGVVVRRSSAGSGTL